MSRRQLEFVYLPLFERTRKNLLSDEEMRQVENALLENAEAGDIMGETGGLRKIRAAQEHRGKSGSARVVYYHKSKRETVYFLLAFAKNAQANLTAAQKKILRAIVAALDAEEWPARGEYRRTEHKA